MVAIGVRLGTDTRKLCWAESPSPSVAATVTVADPCFRACIDRRLPESDTERTVASELEAEKDMASPSGSSKYASRASWVEP